MDEPPIVNKSSDPDLENPYAPAYESEIVEQGEVAVSPLSARYWMAVVASILVLIGLAFFIPGFAVPGAVAIIGGAVRVPLMRRRLARRVPAQPLPNEYALIATSSVFSLIMGMVALFTFAVICIPSGAFFLSSNMSGNDLPFIIAVSISAVLGLMMYAFLFFLSLKLPV